MKLLSGALAFCLTLSLAVSVFPAGAQDAPIILVPHTDENAGIQSVVPDGWTNLGNGIFGRQTAPTDPVVIAQQSASLNAQSLLTALLPQLLLTEAPEPTGSYEGPLSWTLYQVDVSAMGMNLRVDLALAESDGTTYLVLLQSTPDDYQDLHVSVFLPTLDQFAPLAADTTAEEAPYTSEEVTFDSGDITLAGTLTLPEGDPPYAAVVLVTGSGPQDRDGTLGPEIAIRPQALLADALTRAGIAVLRYDERGVGQSTGTYATARLADFAADAAAAIGYLHGRDDINPNEVGLIGHSEGGMVAAMLAASNPDLDFVISLAGPGVTGRETLVVQNQRILEVAGADQAEIDAQLAFLDALFESLDDPEAIEALSYERALEQIAALPEEQREAYGDVEESARLIASQLAQQYAGGWFESFLGYDAGLDWARTTIPVLAIFGGNDVQVDAEQNAPAVEAALAEAGNEDVTIVILPDANHLFQAAETGGLDEYVTLPGEFTPDLLPTIVGWLAERVTLAP